MDGFCTALVSTAPTILWPALSPPCTHTYARCGIIVNVTPLEPEWEGQVTIEISNTTPLPAKIYANEGICQFLFLQGNEPCEISYADKAGKYMHQRGVALPRLG